ncbi:Cell envelope-associated transcriptional attenuator LytR-CpsA-Psr, subfamily A1 [Leifsonia rubra CMS 76R]|nr:Cell envelope-associated transcriptional attenuator LytR-CpsA-Psr, subfamily A1 [Leifsonia rubra CMS 76R]
MTDAPLRHRLKPSAKKRRVRIALISLGSVFVLLIAGVGSYALVLSQQFNSVEKITDAFPDDSLRPPVAVTEGTPPQNILLLGSDTRGTAGRDINDTKGSRSDTMMVVHISGDRKSIQVMSLMRDFWVEIPGYGQAKLNAAMAYGGVPLTVQTIEGITDSRIDHIAMVDFEGFKDISDALGGVTVNNPESFSTYGTPSYTFEKGAIKLGGKQALSFVRERQAFSDGDFTRVANQQLFIKAVMGQVLSKKTLTNPATISNLVSAIAPYMVVDEGLNSSYAVSLGLELRNIRLDDVSFFTMPSLGTGTAGSQSIVRVNWGEVPKIQRAFKDDTLGSYTPPAAP